MSGCTYCTVTVSVVFAAEFRVVEQRSAERAEPAAVRGGRVRGERAAAGAAAGRGRRRPRAARRLAAHAGARVHDRRRAQPPQSPGML